MFGLETIKAMNAEAGRKARLSKAKPAIIEAGAPVTGVPFLGDACDDLDAIAERLDTLFVDISGWGAPNEPALTQEQFIARLHELADEHGTLMVALEECGQFQGFAGVWKASDLDPEWNSILR